MSDGKVMARARVRILLEVDASSWGSDCQLDQVFAQAADSAVGQVRRALSVRGAPCPGIRIIGNPVVEAILTLKEDT